MSKTLPVLTITLDLPLEAARVRIGLRDDEVLDPMEAMRDFAAIRDWLMAVAHENPRRCHVFDANQTSDEVTRDIWGIFEPLL